MNPSQERTILVEEEADRNLHLQKITDTKAYTP